MYAPALVVAAFGLGIAIFAALETEVEERGRRALLGVGGLIIFAIGVMLV